jgi:hypothetical protein
MTLPSACEGMSPEMDERPLLEDVIEQNSEDHHLEH